MQVGTALESAAAIKLYLEDSFSIEPLGWIVIATSLMFSAVKVLDLLEPESRAMDTHISTGGALVMLMGLITLAMTAVGYQIAKRKQARRHAARAAELPAAE